MTIDYKKLLRNNIKKYREQKGLSREVLGGFSGIRGDYVYQIERGRTVPSVKTMLAIANALGIEPYLLFKE